MRFRRLLPLVLLAALGFPSLSCTDASDPTSPVEPQFAKGGKPAQPPDDSAEPILEEFWIYNDVGAGCEQMIHMVVSGTFLQIGEWVTHDHFLNGVQDDDPPVDLHYEFFFGGPATRPMEYREDLKMGHVDVCFTGQRRETVDENGQVMSETLYRDFPATSVDGSGADPFAISPVVLIEETESSSRHKSFEPRGVVVARDTLSRNEGSVSSPWHANQVFQDVSSYAVMRGASPAAGQLFFTELSIANPSCNVTTKVEGRGQNKVTVASASVSAQVSIGYGATGIYNQHFWGEGHFLLTDVLSGESFVSSRVLTPQTDATFYLSREMDVGGTPDGREVLVEFVADYLHPMSGIDPWPGADPDERDDWVYDPAWNRIFTSAGFRGGAWDPVANVSKALDDGNFPVAHSNAVLLTCR